MQTALSSAEDMSQSSRLDRMAQGAVQLSYDIVETAGLLDTVEGLTRAQVQELDRSRTAARAVSQASQDMTAASDRASQALVGVTEAVHDATNRVQRTLETSGAVLNWVAGTAQRMEKVSTIIGKVRQNNTQITEISREVNMLSVNARIEAVRAGQSGQGFIVVADAIKVLSQQTSVAAETIGETVRDLATELDELTAEAVEVSDQARHTISALAEAEAAMARMAEQSDCAQTAAKDIARQLETVRLALNDFAPALRALFGSVTQQIEEMPAIRKRINGLVSLGEDLVQLSVEAGGAAGDTPLIEAVQARATELGQLLDNAIDRGDISITDLFDENYQPVRGSDPPQVMARFTQLTDRLFPAVQEPALELDPRIVFCAAVDRNGYLPTHNRKFSAPQGNDPVWNAANSRNRRIFDDRVGLGAGRSTASFLMQVYRRDMGGGVFAMMKDVSAPIRVKGRHWGGLRLAYRF